MVLCRGITDLRKPYKVIRKWRTCGKISLKGQRRMTVERSNGVVGVGYKRGSQMEFQTLKQAKLMPLSF